MTDGFALRTRTLHLLSVVALSLLVVMSCKSKQAAEQAPTPASSVSPAHAEKATPPSSPTQAAQLAQPTETTGQRWNFDTVEAGSLPERWSAPVGSWRVESAEPAPSVSHVLAQTAQSRSAIFNVVLARDARYGDVEVTVHLRARDGSIDQGGGVVWRAKDERNYYIARYNPLEDNFRVYTVKDGRRRQLESADVRVAHDAWHTLRVRMVGDHIECFLDGQKHLEARDTTFSEPGLVGLWTKADARTEFDDLVVSDPGQVQR
jgi:hypothetical protein